MAKQRSMTEAQQERALAAAGWHRQADRAGVAWTAPPGKGPSGPWETPSAFGYLVDGDACRALAERGWDVPGEYVGNPRTVTLGRPHVLHPEKAPKNITLKRALEIEGLPSIAEFKRAAVERAAS